MSTRGRSCTPSSGATPPSSMRSPPVGDGRSRSTDWRAAITAPEIGLVDIATPNDVHAEQSIAALEAGKHVVCEKPLAGTLADAEAMAAAAARSRRQDLRLVQLPPRTRRRTRPPDRPVGCARTHLPRSRLLPPELGRPEHPARLEVPGRHRRIGRARRPQRTHHRRRPLRHRRGDRVGRGGDRAHVHHRARAPRRRRRRDRRIGCRRDRPGRRQHRRRCGDVPGPPQRRRAGVVRGDAGWRPATTTPTGSRSTETAARCASTSNA